MFVGSFERLSLYQSRRHQSLSFGFSDFAVSRTIQTYFVGKSPAMPLILNIQGDAGSLILTDSSCPVHNQAARLWTHNCGSDRQMDRTSSSYFRVYFGHYLTNLGIGWKSQSLFTFGHLCLRTSLIDYA